ncbi:MAG: metal-sensitive transcriptional regulator [Bacillota bacterium]
MDEVEREHSRANLIRRLNRIEGQVRGIAKMVEEGRYCIEVMDQIAAVRQALNSVCYIMMENHTRGCVIDAVKAGHGEQSVEELLRVMKRYMSNA